eukprot:4294202-Prorocentrum_lima.AAC.1
MEPGSTGIRCVLRRGVSLRSVWLIYGGVVSLGCVISGFSVGGFSVSSSGGGMWSGISFDVG